jgi:hypothetical protein
MTYVPKDTFYLSRHPSCEFVRKRNNTKEEETGNVIVIVIVIVVVVVVVTSSLLPISALLCPFVLCLWGHYLSSRELVCFCICALKTGSPSRILETYPVNVGVRRRYPVHSLRQILPRRWGSAVVLAFFCVADDVYYPSGTRASLPRSLPPQNPSDAPFNKVTTKIVLVQSPTCLFSPCHRLAPYTNPKKR